MPNREEGAKRLRVVTTFKKKANKKNMKRKDWRR